MTKKIEGRDLRRDPDEDNVEGADKFRIDRVFVPPGAPASSTPPQGTPTASTSNNRRDAIPNAIPATRSRGITRSPQERAEESGAVDLRRQLSKLQRQLADVQLELSEKEDLVAAEMEKRVALENEHETLLEDHRAQSVRLDEHIEANESRYGGLEEKIQASQAALQALTRERDELVRQREELAHLRDVETRARDEEARMRDELVRQRDEIALRFDAVCYERDQLAADKDALQPAADPAELVALATERDAAKVERDEALRRVAALEQSLNETHAAWNAERREIEEEHEKEIESAVNAAQNLSNTTLEEELGRLRLASMAAAQNAADRERLEVEVAELKKTHEKTAGDTADKLRSATAALAKAAEEHTQISAELRTLREAQSAESTSAGLAVASARAEGEKARADSVRQVEELKAKLVSVEANLQTTLHELASMKEAQTTERAATIEAFKKLREDHAQELADEKASTAEALARHESAMAKATAELDGVKSSWAIELGKLRDSNTVALAAARGEAEGERAKLESALGAAKTAVSDTRAELHRIRELHGAEIAKLEMQAAQIEAAANDEKMASAMEIAKLKDEHAKSIDEMMEEAERAEKVAASEHAKALAAKDEQAKVEVSQAVFNAAADQAVMARRHHEEIERRETERVELDRTIERLEKAARASQEKYEETMQELLDSNRICAMLETDAKGLDERLASMTKEIEGLKADTSALSMTLTETEMVLRGERERMTSHLQAAIAMIGGNARTAAGPPPPPRASTETAPGADSNAPTPVADESSSPRDVKVVFRAQTDPADW